VKLQLVAVPVFIVFLVLYIVLGIAHSGQRSSQVEWCPQIFDYVFVLGSVIITILGGIQVLQQGERASERGSTRHRGGKSSQSIINTGSPVLTTKLIQHSLFIVRPTRDGGPP